MDNVRRPAPRSTNLGVEIDGKAIFATPTGFKIGSRGKVQYAGEILGLVGKSQARRIRKALRANGFPAAAGAPRLTPAAAATPLAA